MSFGRRIAFVAAAAVAIAVVLASVLVYLLTSNQLHRQIDAQLRDRGHGVGALTRLLLLEARRTGSHAGAQSGSITLPDGITLGPLGQRPNTGVRGKASTPLLPGASDLFGRLPPAPDQVRGYQQVVDSSGKILVRSAANVTLPVDSATRRLAAAGGTPALRDAHVGGLHLRVLAEPFGRSRAVQFAQPLTEVDSLLGRLRLILILIDVGGIALAALLGRVVAGAAVAPIRHLTEATEHVTLTRDLSRRIEPARQDEIGRLAGSFNAMLDALERSMRALDESVHAQRQLVADASHELRTPITSLRTNIEILQQRGQDMTGPEQQRLLADVVEQTEEFTLLMNDLIELARGEEQRTETEEVRLDTLVREVAERASRHGAAASLQLQLEPTLLECVPARLERAVANLIDNAVKHGPPGGVVEIALAAGEITVRDHGAGISEEDLPHVFDRFYRSAAARGRPGSGLGLAIVRQVAQQHGGSVSAERAPGGGALMRLRLPDAELLPVEDDAAAEGAEGPGGSAAARPHPYVRAPG